MPQPTLSGRGSAGDVCPPSPVVGVPLTKTMDPGKQKENVTDLRAMGVEEVRYRVAQV